MKPKKLTFDIECLPLKVRTWGLYDQNAIVMEQDWKLLSIAVKPLGGKALFFGLNKYSEKQLTEIMWKYFDEYDVLIGHNIRKFDVKKMNAKFIEFGLKPPTPYETEDTLRIAKNVAAFTSNKLNDLGEKLGCGSKVDTGGYKLWAGCEANDPKSWKLMEKYNLQDVVLTEQVYYRLLPWSKNSPRFYVKDCPYCGGVTQARGPAMKPNHHRFQCKDCYRWSQRKVC